MGKIWFSFLSVSIFLSLVGLSFLSSCFISFLLAFFPWFSPSQSRLVNIVMDPLSQLHQMATWCLNIYFYILLLAAPTTHFQFTYMYSIWTGKNDWTQEQNNWVNIVCLRVHNEWQWPLSDVHSIMMEKLAQAGVAGGESRPPLTISNISYTLQLRGQIHSPCFYSTPICTLRSLPPTSKVLEVLSFSYCILTSCTVFNVF